MMHGLRDTFDYFECADCGCIQIADVPKDMSRYYPDHYYSIRPERRLSRWLKDQRLRYVASGKGALGSIARKVPRRRVDLSFIPDDLPKSARVLEIGCGRGYLVEELFLRGYGSVRGIDPFMPARATRSSPFKLERKSTTELASEGAKFDLVYLSHSFEHIFEQHETLAAIAELLDERGRAVICVPWVAGEAWETYGTDWVSFDAPRHFFLHSRKSLQVLIDRAGLRLERLYCDSYSLQFWGSEQYKRDIPLFAPNSWAVSHWRSVFTAAQVARWEARAKELNALERGDQVVVWLGKR